MCGKCEEVCGGAQVYTAAVAVFVDVVSKSGTLAKTIYTFQNLNIFGIMFKKYATKL